MDCKIDPAILEAYNQLKMKFAIPYFIFGFAPGNDKEIVLKKEGAKGASWEEFLKEFDDKEPAFSVYDFSGTANGVHKSVPIFLYWIPQEAEIKRKVLYATAKGKVMKELQLVRYFDVDSKKITYEQLFEKIK